jgi:RNA-directed DNA polymerase
LQHALYRAAKADPGRRFHALWDKIYRRDVLWRAWVAVFRNGGAPGIDKTTLADVQEYGVIRLLDEVATELRNGSYRPLPARRVFIPKSGDAAEMRPLSIPSVRDRIVQAAVKIVLEPVFEADMLPCSFGFRPKRGAHDALQVLIDESWRGRRWVVETDIANCFSAIPQEKLMQAIEERVCDQSVLTLLQGASDGQQVGPGPGSGDQHSPAHRCTCALTGSTMMIHSVPQSRQAHESVVGVEPVQ